MMRTFTRMLGVVALGLVGTALAVASVLLAADGSWGQSVIAMVLAWISFPAAFLIYAADP